MSADATTPANRAVDEVILTVRGGRVILDADLARLYGVTTKRLNEQMRRNSRRFPEDFAFRLTAAEKAEVVANCDHLRQLRFASVLPLAFTEYGAIMAANVLHSERAIQMSIVVVRTFVRLREMFLSHADLARRLDELEARYDAQFKVVFDAIRELRRPAGQSSKRIGFRAE